MRNIMEAVRVGEITLVGVLGESFPLDKGNCFSLETADSSYRIVNFVYENLEHLLSVKFIDWPIQIRAISEYKAKIHDARIPDNYYPDKYCSCCCPKEFLPIHQQDEMERQIMRGQRVEYDNAVMIDNTKAPRL